MSNEITHGSVFDALESDIGVAEQLKIKTQIMHCIRNYIKEESITQNIAAERMGVQRSRIGDLSRGHISVFSIDALVAMAARVGLYPVKFDQNYVRPKQPRPSLQLVYSADAYETLHVQQGNACAIPPDYTAVASC